MKSIPTYLLLIVLSTIMSCQSPNAPSPPSSEKSAIYQSFIAAVNTGDSSQIKGEILKYWSDTLIGEENRWLTTDLRYWLAANKEFGPLAFVSFGEDEFNDNEVAWFRGKISRDWIGFEFDFNAANEITGTNVLRSCTPSNTTALDTISREKIDGAYLQTYLKDMEAADLFSGRVLVAKGADILYEGSHGYADKTTNQPLTDGHQMVIASTTKMFTAVAIAQLVEQEKLDLQAPLSSYLNDFPSEIGDLVNMAHLLTHTAGIELDDLEGFMDEIVLARSIDEFYQINLRYLPQLDNYDSFTTLDALNYSNENFDILGRLIEVISGQNFYAYLQENIFAVLDMQDTGPVDTNKENATLAHNYQLNRAGTGTIDGGFRDTVPFSNLSMSRPAGSFYSTPRDLYAFLRGLNEGRLINPETKQTFTSKKVENLVLPIYQSWYGYGFYVNERQGLLNYGHAGGMPGVSSRCEYYPEQDVYVIVTSNYNGSANLVANHLSSVVPYLGK